MTADIQDQQGGYDPWWQTKTGGNNVEKAILFKCDVGKIFKSIDGGQSWNDVTPTTDPPNTWSDGTPATIADLTFTQRVDSIHQSGLHIFIARATVGGNERCWLLQTTDDAVTWTWYPVDSYTNPSVSSAITTQTINGVDDFLTLVSNSLTTGNWYALDGNNGPWVYSAANSAWLFSVADDAGDTHDGSMGARDPGTVMFLIEPTADFPTTVFSRAIDTQYARMIWRAHKATIYAQVADYGSYADNSGSMDVVLKSAMAGLPDEFYPVWADVDTENGSRMYLTAWVPDASATDGWIVLQQRDTTTLALENEWNLGEATLAEVQAQTWWAAPMTPAFDQDVIFCFGRMENPQNLGSTQHLIWTQDGGDTWASLVSSLGSDYVTALQSWAQGAIWRVVFVVNDSASNVATFWDGTTGTNFSQQSTLPFRVNVDAMTIYNQQIAVAARAVGAGGEMVMLSSDLGLNWQDISGSLPTDGSVKSLVFV